MVSISVGSPPRPVSIIDSIKKNGPSHQAFVLENVVGLLDAKFRPVYHAIVNALELANYEVMSAVLDTSEHGLPQARRRLYIVGLRRDAKTKAFSWPEPLPKFVPVSKLLSYAPAETSDASVPPAGRARDNVIAALQKHKVKLPRFNLQNIDEFVVDVGCSVSRRSYMVNRFPAITSTRAALATGGWWRVKMRRASCLEDYLLLQGIPTNYFNLERCGVSRARLSHMCGNAMSVNVLERLLIKVLASIGIFPSHPKPDIWRNLVDALG